MGNCVGFRDAQGDEKVLVDGGVNSLAVLTSYRNCVSAEYIWLDANQALRSKTMTMSSPPKQVGDLRVWNFDGSQSGQADRSNSEVLLIPRAIFEDPFRGAPHILVLAEAFNGWDKKPAKGNTRAECAELMEKYKELDPWFGIEQDYTLMKPGKVGEAPFEPFGFNDDGSDPAPQGPYATGVGKGIAIGRAVAEEHYQKCLQAGVKIGGINAEVMPGQWEFQIGPCRGIEIGDHLTVARYILLRLTESFDCAVTFSPKPREGWSGAGCHTNFSVAPMRTDGGMEVIAKVCEAFAKVAQEHIQVYGEGNEKRLTGKNGSCGMESCTHGVANRLASIRIPREVEANGRGYLEDRRPAANCDPYRVTSRIMKTTGEAVLS